MLAMPELSPGFVDPVVDSQAVFRTVLHAMAHPATIREVPVTLAPPAPLNTAAAAVCLTLLDAETPVWLQTRGSAVPDYLRFHCGSPVIGAPGAARFAVIHDVANMPVMQAFDAGSDEYPDRSATLIVQVEDLLPDGALTFAGPGIRERARVGIAGLRLGFWDEWRENTRRFPCGVDLIFAAGTRVLALPRTAQVEG